MARGDKSAYTDKQKRMAEHIEEGYEHGGVGKDEAKHRAWATVNKETGGGRKAGTARSGGANHVSSVEESRRRSEAARKGWETRRRASQA